MAIKVLVVDDHPASLRLIRPLGAGLSHAVLTSASCQQAAERVQSERIDLAFLGMGTAHPDSLVVVRSIRNSPAQPGSHCCDAQRHRRDRDVAECLCRGCRPCSYKARPRKSHPRGIGSHRVFRMEGQTKGANASLLRREMRVGWSTSVRSQVEHQRNQHAPSAHDRRGSGPRNRAQRRGRRGHLGGPSPDRAQIRDTKLRRGIH